MPKSSCPRCNSRNCVTDIGTTRFCCKKCGARIDARQASHACAGCQHKTRLVAHDHKCPHELEPELLLAAYVGVHYHTF